MTDQTATPPESHGTTAANVVPGPGSAGQTSPFARYLQQSPEARHGDSFAFLQGLFGDKSLDDEHKLLIFKEWRDRFRNRRTMAYWSMRVLILSLAFFAAIFTLDGILLAAGATTTSITTSIEENLTLLVWLEGFFLSVVGFYFGASSLAPNS